MIVAFITIAVILMIYGAVSRPLDARGVTSAMVFTATGVLVGSSMLDLVGVDIETATAERLCELALVLLHGFGFASGLTTMGLPPAEIPLALLVFNLGVEVGQLGFVALILLLDRAFRALQILWPRFVAALPGYVVGSLGAYWTIQRVAVLLGVMR